MFYCSRGQRLLTSATSRGSIHTSPTLSHQCRPALTTLAEDELMIQNTVQKFAREMIGPKVAQMDREGKMCPELIKQCFEHGLMGIEISPEFGGAGMKFMASIITIEELARVDPSVSVCVDVQNTIVGIPLRKWGSKEQQEKWFPRLSTDTVGSFCLSEWSSGSDAFALKTTARREGKNFVLNGTKAWITNSAEAGCFIVMANVDHSLGYKGITAFIVDGTNPGIRVGKREDKLGIRASSTCEVVLTDCVVSEEDVLGEIGKGYKYAIEALNEGRIGIAAQMLGLAQGALDATMPYINQRQQFGKPISSFQGVMFDYAHAATGTFSSTDTSFFFHKFLSKRDPPLPPPASSLPHSFRPFFCYIFYWYIFAYVFFFWSISVGTHLTLLPPYPHFSPHLLLTIFLLGDLLTLQPLPSYFSLPFPPM
eukprot:TRINITY_DN56_c0_g1_i1.p1 TRINITY_DN56_c0_g1~~TRINITY_DN56_c0_g1_i1.p1  ORF type:complete len:424 (-),score=70.55 TRINITY_DN56_c0_g1_i1:457-1728(-)